MNSTLPVNVKKISPVTNDTNLTFWQQLDDDERAFVAAYVENSYSVPEACNTLHISRASAAGMLKRVTIRKAVTEVQEQLDGIDFLNEKWVKAQLLRIYPMVIGDEPVPFLTNTGEQSEGLKFDAGVALKIIEYVAPKAQKQTIDISINNIHKLTDAQLEEIAKQGRVIEHEE